jgi:hypothetical protein
MKQLKRKILRLKTKIKARLRLRTKMLRLKMKTKALKTKMKTISKQVQKVQKTRLAPQAQLSRMDIAFPYSCHK